MATSDILSVLALVISILSCGTSFYFSYRDRVALKVFCRFYNHHPEYDRTHILIKIINIGRRTAILRLFGGPTDSSGWCAEYLDKANGGLRLGENEFHEIKIYKEDLFRHLMKMLFIQSFGLKTH